MVRIHLGQFPSALYLRRAARESLERTRHMAKRSKIRIGLAVVGLFCLSGWRPVPTDRVPHRAGPAPLFATPDSAELADRARDIQRRFERVRIRHLPWAWGSWGGSCDEVVGRMCWRHDDPEDDWTKPEEPEELVRERGVLLDSLDAIGEQIPGDRWILAQRVWYLGEAGAWGRAIQLTEACRGGDAEWCAALRGLALHESGRYSEAAVAFDEAGSVVEELEGKARDASRALYDRRGRSLLDDLERDLERDLGPNERTQPDPAVEPLLPADSLMWVLADPLYLVEGNDRRTEHEARRVVDRIRVRARNPYSLGWGKDMSELVWRYGWAVAWERVRGSGVGGATSIVGRHPSKGRDFIASGDVLADPTNAGPEQLAPRAERPRTTYRPRYTSVVRPAGGQAFAFDRGDSLAFVIAFDEAPTPAPPSEGGSLEVLAGAFGVDLTRGTVAVGEEAAPGRWLVRTANHPQLLSAESLELATVLPDSARESRRYRRVLGRVDRPEGVLALSDLMLLEPGVQPASLLEAAAVLRTPSVAPGESVTVAWEVYGLGFDDSQVGYEVSVGRKRGFLSSVGDWIGVGEGAEGLLIDWSEPQQIDPGPQLRYVEVRFPEVDEGTYVLRVGARVAGRAQVVREREITVTRSR